MEQFLRQTGVLAPLCFLLLQTIQVVIPVVPGGVSCIIGVAMFGPLYGFFLNYAGMVTGSVISFSSGKTLWTDLSFKVCIRRNFSEIHFLDRKGKEIRYILSSGFDSSSMPDDLLCLIAGLTSMSMKKYLVFTLLGRPFSLLAYSLGGALILENLTALF